MRFWPVPRAALLLALLVAAAGAAGGAWAGPSLLSATVQVRTLEEARPPPAAPSRRTVAVVAAAFDEPLYVAREGLEGGALSLPAASAFMQLRPEYRQLMYGTARLRCAGGAVFESFPPSEGGDQEGEERHLMPLPQAEYTAPGMRWLNVLSRPERDRARRNTNELRFMIVLDAADELRRRGCDALVLPEGEAERSWGGPRARIEAADGTRLHGAFPLAPAEPPAVSYHSYSRTSAPATEYGQVFLAERETVEANARGIMGIILPPIMSKLMQIAGPCIERLNEFVIPMVTAALTMGQSAASSFTEPKASTSTPFVSLRIAEKFAKFGVGAFVEVAAGAATPSASAAGAADIGEWRRRKQAELTSTPDGDGGPPRFREERRGAGAPRVSRASWAFRHSADAPRLLEAVRGAVEDAAAADGAAGAGAEQRFTELRDEHRRADERVRLATAPGEGTAGVSPTEPGDMPKKLIEFLIPELTGKLSTGLTDALADAVAEEVLDLQEDDSLQEVQARILDSTRHSVPAGVGKAVSTTVPAVLERTVPSQISMAAGQVITRTLTRGLVHALAVPTALVLARPASEEYVCSLCHYQHYYCDLCSWTSKKRRDLAYNVEYYAAFYSDLYAMHFGGGEPVPGWPA